MRRLPNGDMVVAEEDIKYMMVVFKQWEHTFEKLKMPNNAETALLMYESILRAL